MQDKEVLELCSTVGAYSEQHSIVRFKIGKEAGSPLECSDRKNGKQKTPGKNTGIFGGGICFVPCL